MGRAMTVGDSAPRQKVYILRLWETRPASTGEPPAWRFSLEDPQNRERHGFASMEMLVAFLIRSTEDVSLHQKGDEDTQM